MKEAILLITLAPAAYFDIKGRWIPVWIVLAGWGAVLAARPGIEQLLRAAAVILILAGIRKLTARTASEPLGEGDLYLFVLMAAALPTDYFLTAFFLCMLCALISSGVKKAVPLAPCMLIGYFVALTIFIHVPKN